MSNPRLKLKISGELSSKSGAFTLEQKEIIRTAVSKLKLKKYLNFSAENPDKLSFEYLGKRTNSQSSNNSAFAEKISYLISELQQRDIDLKGRISLKGYYEKQVIKVRNGFVTYSIRSGGLSFLNRKNVEITPLQSLDYAA